MHFGSDNVVGASPKVMEALLAANTGAMASYGDDELAQSIEKRFSEIFEKDVGVFLMSTGTAANGLALACITPPWGEVICHQDAHVMTDECGGPEQWTGGAKITPLAGVGGKILSADLEATLSAPRRGIHSVKPASLSLTNLTECGTRYTADETAALAAVAHGHGLKVHLDGARFTNALVSSNESPAALTWKAGVDVLCLGATKNGALAAEAVIFFDKALAETANYRRMRGGHLISKGRLLSGQFNGWLANDHWLELATTANHAAKRLSTGIAALPNARLAWPTDGNEVFAVIPEALEQKLLSQGFKFYRWRHESMAADQKPGAGEVLCRLVCSWQTQDADIDSLLRAMAAG
ncbi:MAG: threonine aldolase family protein [Beijerinckiaceae bacterium]